MQSSPSSKPRALSGGRHAPSCSAQQISSSVRLHPESSRCFVPQSSATWWSPGPSSMAGRAQRPVRGNIQQSPSALQPASANQAFLHSHLRLRGPNAPSLSTRRISSSAQPPLVPSRCCVPQSSAMCRSPRHSSMAVLGLMSSLSRHLTGSRCHTTSFSPPSRSHE